MNLSRSMVDFRGFGVANPHVRTLNPPSAFVQWRRLPPMTMSMSPCRIVSCLASATTTTSGVNTQQLREQLDRLHKEAETTASKANSARLRLIRLSEAADSLRRQAVLRIRTGKENDARELLYQKKMILQAMEKSKNRIELLDELAAKLHQVISAKETQLLGNVSSDFEVRDEARTNVRIVPPKDEYIDTSVEDKDTLSSLPLHLDEKSQADFQSLEDMINKNDGLLKENNNVKADAAFSLNVNNSYPDFLKNIDRQLRNIEDELTTFLRYAALIFGNEDKMKDSKVQVVTEILENVYHIRGRIAKINIESGVET